jgi:O-antigen/teichoic acid export membrane protein
MSYSTFIKDKTSILTKNKEVYKYLENTFWLMFERVFTLSVAFVLGIFIARYFGPRDLGILDFSRGISIFFTTFAGLSVEQFLVKMLLEREREKNSILGTIFFLKLSASLISLLCIILLYFFNFFDEIIIFYIVIIITTSSAFSSFDVLRSYYQSKTLSRKIAFATSLQIIVSTLLKILFLYLELSVVYFAFIFLIDAIVFASGLIYTYFQSDDSIFNWTYNHSIAKETLSQCWPTIISGLIIIIYMRVDQLMIKWLLDAENVGYYSAAVRLSEIWFVVGSVINNSLFPAIIKLKISNPAIYKDRLQALLSLMVVVALLIIIPISLFSSTIVNFLFGPEFAPASGVLSIHAWSLLFIFLGLVGQYWMISENLQKLNLYQTLIGLTTNVILNQIMIPLYGINGAALATLISQMFASYLSYLILNKSRTMFWAQTRALFFIHIGSFLLSKFYKKI